MKDDYPTIDDAIAEGLFHANCGHSVSIYIPDVTPKRRIPAKDPGGYQRRVAEKSADRNRKKWLKRKAVAITPQEKQKAIAKHHEWVAETNRLKDLKEVRE
jgi:hypothetical protein